MPAIQTLPRCCTCALQSTAHAGYVSAAQVSVGVCALHSFLSVPHTGYDALVHKRYALSAWKSMKACMRREVILVRRHSFTYIFRIAQVCSDSMLAPLYSLSVWTCSACLRHGPEPALLKGDHTLFPHSYGSPCHHILGKSQCQWMM